MMKLLVTTTLLFIIQSSLSQKNVTNPTDYYQRALEFTQLAGSFVGKRPDSVIYYGNTALKLAKKAKNDSLIMVSGNALGASYVELRQLDSAAKYYQMVVSMADTSVHLSNAINGLGIVAQHQNNDARALEYYLRSLDIDKRLGNTKGLPASYLNISTILNRFGKPKEAIAYTKEALKSSIAQNHTDGILHAQVALANQYYGQQRFDSAIYYSSAAYAKGLEINYDIAKMMAGTVLSAAYILSGRYSEGKRYADSAFFYADKYEVQSVVDVAKVNRSYAYVGLGDFGTALQEVGTVKDPTVLRNIHEVKAQAYAGQGNFDKSYTHMLRFRLLTDSLNNVALQSKVADLHTQYETAQKDQEIQNLTQEATIQSLQLSQRNNQLLTIGLFFLLIVVGGILYYRQFKLKKERTATELEQRFLRSQLNPHFIFNSMTAIQHYLMNTDTENAGHYLGLFSTLMRQILENSREEFITLREEVHTLRNYLELQALRFRNKFEYEIIVDEELDQDYSGVPPMFAQPFIENALEHGLFKKESDNKITIRFSRLNNASIGLEVIDSGIGMNKAIKEADHKSLATQITKERLEVMEYNYKSNMKMISENILNDEGEIEGLRINLTLPTKLVAA